MNRGAAHLQYASDHVGQAFQPGPNKVPAVGVNPRRNTVHAMAKVFDYFVGTLPENWLPFTWPILSRFLPPRAPGPAFASPYDLDAGERITRFGGFPSAMRPFPYPYEIGAVSGFMPMLDQYSMAWSWAKNAYGPGVLTPIPLAWQTSYPNLQKVTG